MAPKLFRKPILLDWNGLYQRVDEHGDIFITIESADGDVGYQYLYVPAYGRGIMRSSKTYYTAEEAMNAADKLWNSLPAREKKK